MIPRLDIRYILVLILLSLHVVGSVATGAERSRSGKPAEPIQEWEVVGQFGMIRTVHVSPAGLKDKFFVAQVLHTVMTKYEKSKPIQIMLFDDKHFTPKGFPMTDTQMLHLKAQYNWNPNAKFEKFVWVSVADRKSSPPKLKETEAKIRPGYAD